MTAQSRTALISVSDKSGLKELAHALIGHGFRIISSGGTYRCLQDAGIEARKVSDVTGFPEILDGRVKTLHPRIHGAILARYDLESHVQELALHDIESIELVVVNLYPFKETIASGRATPEQAIEQIDIGGPTLIRAAAKNFKHITVLTSPRQYQDYLGILNERGQSSPEFRLEAAQAAFLHIEDYDHSIAGYLGNLKWSEGALETDDGSGLPEQFQLFGQKVQSLRYGENPHQQAALYMPWGAQPKFRQHQGKQLSFNNLVDMESAWCCVSEFQATTAVVIKHTNPCGVGCDEVLERAFLRAREVDPVSAFGGVIAVNCEMDEATARRINENFAELVIAPSYTLEALACFRKKKNLRVLEMLPGYLDDSRVHDVKRLCGGILVQERDRQRKPCDAWDVVSNRKPHGSEMRALDLAWRIVKHVKSNAIVYADAGGAIGIGAGQMSRVDSAQIAIRKAEMAHLSVRGSVMASDAFFPFRDSIDAAAEAGVTAVVEPGGSIRDAEVIEAANEHGMALCFTGMRHFKH